MQPTTTTIKRASFLAVFGLFSFSSGALFGRTVPSPEAIGAIPPASGGGGAPNSPDAVRYGGALPGGVGEGGSFPAAYPGSDGTMVFAAEAVDSTASCPTLMFEEDKGGGVSLAYEHLDSIAWNASATVLVVEHPARYVVIEGARLDLLRDRFRHHTCSSVAASPPPEADDGASAATDTEPGDSQEPYIARVRVVPPYPWHFGKQNEFVSEEQSP